MSEAERLGMKVRETEAAFEKRLPATLSFLLDV
jgi:hypothetical protein